MCEFYWYPNGGNTKHFGEWMSAKGDSPTCYVQFERVTPDRNDTQAKDGYLVTVCKPHTYVTYDNTGCIVMCKRVYTDTLCEACAYAEQWCSDHEDRWAK